MESKKRTLQTMSPLKIGNVEMQNPLVLAPMAGVTDLPFRVLCKEQGAGLICMEMVSAKAILYKNKNTEDLMTIHPGEHPVSLQLFGSDPEILAQIAAQIEERPFDILDFNMGCPVPKVVNNGEGSALMKDPALVRKIVTGMVKAVKKPVTVKIRKGFNEESANAVEIAKILEDCGVAAIAVHGRTRAQFYSGKADWDIIRQVKEAVSIPVIGNGDVVDAASAEALVEQTGWRFQLPQARCPRHIFRLQYCQPCCKAAETDFLQGVEAQIESAAWQCFLRSSAGHRRNASFVRRKNS